jgi:cytochrome c oxidase subunit 2
MRAKRHGARRWLIPVVLGVMLVAAGCAPNAKQDSLKPKSTYARSIYHLIMPVFGVAGVIFVIVLGGLLFFSIRYRVSRDEPIDDENLPPQMHGSFKMELGWTLLPALILAVVGVFTVYTVFQLAEAPPKKNLHVEVIGQQWWWEFRYDLNGDGKYDEIVTADELVIPAGEKVALHVDSRDVIHGFWAPELNGKRDVVPGHPTDFAIAADHPGEYYGQCTVFCGLSHANMRFKVIALDHDAYEAWEKHQQEPATSPSGGLAAEGQSLFKAQCAYCHEVKGLDTQPTDVASHLVSGAAPNLTHLMTRTIFASGEFDLRKDIPACTSNYLDSMSYSIPDCVNEADLRRWLQDPEALLPQAPSQGRGMPNLHLSSQQIDQLVAYLETLN